MYIYFKFIRNYLWAVFRRLLLKGVRFRFVNPFNCPHPEMNDYIQRLNFTLRSRGLQISDIRFFRSYIHVGLVSKNKINPFKESREFPIFRVMFSDTVHFYLRLPATKINKNRWLISTL